LIRFAVVSATRGERVTVSSHEIRLEYLGRTGQPKTIAVMPVSEVEELELCKSTERQADGRVIAVRSDITTIEFGGRLEAREQEWLYAVLWTLLTAGPKDANQ
jgi:hypothetical protein